MIPIKRALTALWTLYALVYNNMEQLLNKPVWHYDGSVECIFMELHSDWKKSDTKVSGAPVTHSLARSLAHTMTPTEELSVKQIVWIYHNIYANQLLVLVYGAKYLIHVLCKCTLCIRRPISSGMETKAILLTNI